GKSLSTQQSNESAGKNDSAKSFNKHIASHYLILSWVLRTISKVGSAVIWSAPTRRRFIRPQNKAVTSHRTPNWGTTLRSSQRHSQNHPHWPGKRAANASC